MRLRTVAFLTLALAFVLCLPAALDASGCGVPVVRQRAFVVNHHVAAVAVEPVYVATFAAVPVAVPHYSVGYQPDGGEIAELRKAVRELSKTVQELRQVQAAGPPVSDELNAKAWQLLSAKCATCHTGPDSKGRVQIFLAPGQPNRDVDRFALWDAAESGRMPKGKEPVPDDEARLLREWLKAGRKTAQK